MFENPMDVSVDSLINHYARRDRKDAKWPDVEFAMKGVPGTPCCVQMSRGFNGAGLTVPARSWSRATGKFPGGMGWRTFYSVDEVEVFLAEKYGDSENLRTGENGKQRGAGAIKSLLKGIPGVLVMRHAPIRKYPPANKFEHTEIWDGNGFVQQDMAVDALLESPYVKFWPDKTYGWISGPDSIDPSISNLA
jgi:hypothetical protein